MLTVTSGLRADLLPPFVFFLDGYDFVGEGGMGNDSDARREALFLSFHFSVLDLDIHIVGIFKLFFIGASLPVEPTRILQFKLSLFFEEIGVYVRTHFFDSVLGVV